MAKEITMKDLHTEILSVKNDVKITMKDLYNEILSNRKEIKNIEKVLTALVKDIAATNKILIAHQFDNIAIKNMYMREEHPDWLRGNRLMDSSGKRYKRASPKKH